MAPNGSGGKAKRAAVIDGLRERIRGASGLVFLDAQRLDSAETTDLRRAIRPTAASLKVVKNRLMRLACEAEKIPECGDWLKRNTAVAFLGPDPVTAVKVLTKFAAEHEKLALKGALLDKRPVGLDGLKALAALPGRNELLTMTAAAMKAPFVRAARDFSGVLVKLALLMKEAAKKAPQA
jgi:large subunit ribosomal protein L10